MPIRILAQGHYITDFDAIAVGDGVTFQTQGTVARSGGAEGRLTHNRVDIVAIYIIWVATKPCSVCVLCAVCLGGMYRKHICRGLAMVIAVNVGHIWEWPRLSCSRRHIFGICQLAGGSVGRHGAAISYCPHTDYDARL